MGAKRWLGKGAAGLQLLADTPKVMIATPAQDTCLASYTRSLVLCVGQALSEGMTVGYHIAQYSMLPLSRNLLVQIALDGGWTHILFIDSDMEFPPDLISRLVRHKKKIVGVNCMARRRPYYLTARDAAGEEVLTTESSTGLERVQRVGTGIMLIHLGVFRQMPQPWFEYRWLPEKQVFRGEDYVFCEKANEAGHEIYIDHDVSKEVSHVGTFQYTPLIRAGFEAAQAEEERIHAESERQTG